MAFDIGFSFDCKLNFENFRKTFISPNGEEYVVEVKLSNSNTTRPVYYGHGARSCEVTLSWKRMSPRHFRFRSYSELDHNMYDDSNFFVSDKLSFTRRLQNMSFSQGRIVILVKVVPYEDISKCLNVAAPSNAQNNQVTKVKPVVEKRLEHLSSDLENLYQTGQFSDVTLTDGSKEIHAHKLILSMRSPVFSKMLQHPMKENKENRITIKDISIEVLKSLLKFMYSGTAVLNDMKMARDLYVAADKYDVKHLKNICSEMLKSVNLDSVLDTLLLADLYQDAQLKQAALNYIASNYSNLKTLSNWNKFMKEHQSLAIEILSFVVDRKV